MRHLEIDLSAIEHNFDLCKSRLGRDVGVIPVVKADAYGHGAVEVSRALEQRGGVDYFAVAFPSEGAILRRGGVVTPIIVLNADRDSFAEAIEHRLEPEIYNFETLKCFLGLLDDDEQYPVHIKFDTGMNRLGFRTGDLQPLLAALRDAGERVRVMSVFSHLAAADDPAEDDFTRRQIADFQQLSDAVAAVLPYPFERHIANTNGTARFAEAQFDMVRLGIALYGVGIDGVRQAATLRTRVVNISHLPKGATVGYNRRGVLKRDSVIATIPIGYADGLSRAASNGTWSVLVDGRAAPIVGNVCMDSLMVDVTNISNAEVGSEVTIFSPIHGNTIADLATALGTIPYEIMTSVSARLKRVHVR